MSGEILIIGDLHFKHDNIDQCDQLAKQLNELWPRVAHVVLLGDLLHYHERLHTPTLNRLCKFLAHIPVPMTILVGNHDMLNNRVHCDPDGHWLNVLKKWPNVTIVDYPQYITIGGLVFLAAPYVHAGRLSEAFTQFGVSPDEADYCVLHQEIKNCKMGPIESQEGDEYVWNTPCMSGHIHDSQQVGNVLYVGAAFEHSFGAHKCYLTLLNPHTRDITRVPVKVDGKRLITRVLTNGHIEMPAEMVGKPHMNKCIVHAHNVEEYYLWTQSEEGIQMANSYRLVCKETRMKEASNIACKNVACVYATFLQRLRAQHPECEYILGEFDS